MRYVVTGAAGLHRLASRRGARRRGPRRRRRRLLHRLLRPGAEGGERARSRRAAARPRRGALDFAGVDGVFHLAAQPGVRSFGDVFPLYVRRNVLATQRVFEAAAARAACASSSPRRRRSTARPSATRRRRTRSRARSRRTGSRSSRASTSRARTRAASALDAVVAPLLHRLRPAPAAGHGLPRDLRRRCWPRAARSSSTATASSRAASRTSRDAVDATDRGDGAGAGRGGLQRRRRRGGVDARGDRAARADRRADARRRDASTPPRATVAGRRPTRRGSATRSAGSRGRRSRTGLSAQWSWASGRVAARHEPRRSAPAQAAGTVDPEAEQEVDFGRYWRALAVALVAARSAASSSARSSATLISLGTQRNVTRRPRTSISASRTRAERQTRRAPERSDEPEHGARDRDVAARRRLGSACKRGQAFRSGISTQPMLGNLAKVGQHRAVLALTVQVVAAKRVASCAANGLAQRGRRRISELHDTKLKKLDEQFQRRRIIARTNERIALAQSSRRSATTRRRDDRQAAAPDAAERDGRSPSSSASAAQLDLRPRSARRRRRSSARVSRRRRDEARARAAARRGRRRADRAASLGVLAALAVGPRRRASGRRSRGRRCSRGSSVAVVVPAARRGGADRGDARRASRRSSTASSSSTTRRRTPPRSGRAPSATRASW